MGTRVLVDRTLQTEMIGGTLKKTAGGTWLAYVRWKPVLSPSRSCWRIRKEKGRRKNGKKTNKSRAKETADVYLITCNGKKQEAWKHLDQQAASAEYTCWALVCVHARTCKAIS